MGKARERREDREERGREKRNESYHTSTYFFPLQAYTETCKMLNSILIRQFIQSILITNEDNLKLIINIMHAT